MGILNLKCARLPRSLFSKVGGGRQRESVGMSSHETLTQKEREGNSDALLQLKVLLDIWNGLLSPVSLLECKKNSFVR